MTDPMDQPIVGYWDYDSTSMVVMVDTDGAGMIACATTHGDQLRHLGCPLEGPCAADSTVTRPVS